MFNWRFLKKFQPHEKHMAFSIAHYPSMKLLLNSSMESKFLTVCPLT